MNIDEVRVIIHRCQAARQYTLANLLIVSLALDTDTKVHYYANKLSLQEAMEWHRKPSYYRKELEVQVIVDISPDRDYGTYYPALTAGTVYALYQRLVGAETLHTDTAFYGPVMPPSYDPTLLVSPKQVPAYMKEMIKPYWSSSEIRQRSRTLYEVWDEQAHVNGVLDIPITADTYDENYTNPMPAYMALKKGYKIREQLGNSGHVLRYIRYKQSGRDTLLSMAGTFDVDNEPNDTSTHVKLHVSDAIAKKHNVG